MVLEWAQRTVLNVKKTNIMSSAVIFMIISLFICLFAVGCEEGQSYNYIESSQSVTGMQKPQNVPANGFCESMLDTMDVKFGVSVPSDIISIYGQPQNRTDMPMGNETVVTLYYDFGSFQFDCGRGEDSVLFYVEIYAAVTGPNGLTVGMEGTQAAECIYAGSGEVIASASEMEVYFYGNGDSSVYGKYTVLTEEFASANDIYSLEYAFSDSSGKNVKLVAALNASKIVTSYTIERI